MSTARGFQLIPAIDLREGRIVRLEQGDFERTTVFDGDPADVAASFVAAGARWLHVVDLDGAKAGAPRNGPTVKAITATVGDAASVEAAGGLRTAAAVDAILRVGVRRVVFGTAAIRDPELVRQVIERHGSDRVAVAVDVRGNEAVGDAWQAGAGGVGPDQLIRELADVGVTTFEVTAIDRDGLLGGPDLELLERLVRLERGQVIASGGVRDIEDARATRDVGCAGAIVGRALYDGSFSLRFALESLDGPE
jgi:phosphoribosylformimino-5-aminoimidazole carboxamide ribotide isomerase